MRNFAPGVEAPVAMASTKTSSGLENGSLETARSRPQAVVVKPDDRHGPKLPQGVDRDLLKIFRKFDRDVIPHSVRRIQTALVVQRVGQVSNHAHLLAGFADRLKSGDLCARGKRRDAEGRRPRSGSPKRLPPPRRRRCPGGGFCLQPAGASYRRLSTW